MKNWLRTVLNFAPYILTLTPLAPIANEVANAISEAEQIKGATGKEKLAHVVNIGVEAAKAANDQANRVVVDPDMVPDVAAKAVAVVVEIANGIHKAPPVVEPPPAPPVE